MRHLTQARRQSAGVSVEDPAFERETKGRKHVKHYKLTLLAGAGALALAGAVGGSQTAHAQKVEGPSVNWKLSLWGKRRAFTEGMEYVSDQVAKRTDGKFTIKLFYGEQL